jgi:hypothetical protein
MSLQAKEIIVDLNTTAATVKLKSELGYHVMALTWVNGPASRDLPPSWWLSAVAEFEEQRLLRENPALKL